MRARPLLLALLLFGSGAGLGAAVVVAPVPEQLVEGHTVFVTIQNVANTTRDEEYAAAVAVLVREVTRANEASRFPGVLWFNDQYLVPAANLFASEEPVERHPCSGAVLAVAAGGADPRVGAPATFAPDAYVESYLVTDPNDYTWNVDKWRIDGRLVWSVAILDNQTGYSEPDDGVCDQSPASPRCGYGVEVPVLGCHRMLRGVHVEGAPSPQGKDPGDHGYRYPCGDADPCAPVRYNAVLYFLLADLPADGSAPKNHTEESIDWYSDVTACHAYSIEWACPDNDDDREGNSHPYNPDHELHAKAGFDNHGGSDDCGAGAGEANCHATRRIDIYYGVAAAPPVRAYRVLDLVGSSAPYHCHEDALLCDGSAGVS